MLLMLISCLTLPFPNSLPKDNQDQQCSHLRSEFPHYNKTPAQDTLGVHEKCVTKMEYSPDCDFWLFPKLKSNIQQSVTTLLKDVPESKFKNVSRNGIIFSQSAIISQRVYLEDSSQ